jgi:hypothetical protein
MPLPDGDMMHRTLSKGSESSGNDTGSPALPTRKLGWQTANGGSPLKIMILHVFVGTILLMGRIDPPVRAELSLRLAALRFRHAQRNRMIRR